MKTYTHITPELARGMAEMSIYMGWYFIFDREDDPSDDEHSYAVIHSVLGNGNDARLQDFWFRLVADCEMELDEMWEKLRNMIHEFITLITTNPNDHK
jgi:hypothetical protein